MNEFKAEVTENQVNFGVSIRLGHPFGIGLRAMDKLLLYGVRGLTLSRLYEDSLRDVLNTLVQRLNESDALDIVECHNLADISGAIVALRDLLPDDVTQRMLMEQPRESWPAGVEAAADRVTRIGFLLPFNHVPDSAKATVRYLFEKRKFSEVLGRYTFGDLYARAKADCTPREKHVIKIGRGAGLLRRHPALPFSTADPVVNADKNDRACYQNNCYDYDDSYCEPPEGMQTGCNAMSDPWDPNAAPPNML